MTLVEVPVSPPVRESPWPPHPVAGRSALAAAGIGTLVVAGAVFTWFARDVLLLAFAGILAGVFLHRLARALRRRTGMPASIALAIVVLGIVLLFTVAFWIQGPAIAREVTTLREELPKAAQQLRDRIERTELGARAFEAMPSAAEMLPHDGTAISRVTGAVSRTFGMLASFVIILFLGLVFAATPGAYVRGLLALVPRRRVARTREVLVRIYDTLWWWLLGRLVSMTFIGLLTGFGLQLLGIPLAFVLGLIAALLSFIPNVGPILSAVPAVLLALVQGPREALWVVALYVGVQIIESYLLAPVIDRKTVYLPPAVTVIAQLLMALAAGLMGVALATPLTAVLVVVITMLYVQDVLGRVEVEVQSPTPSSP